MANLTMEENFVWGDHHLGIILDNPICNGLNSFRASFESICKDKDTSCCSPEAVDELDHEDLQNLAKDLLSTLHCLPVVHLLPHRTGLDDLEAEIAFQLYLLDEKRLPITYTNLLLKAALATDLDDARLWKHVYQGVVETVESSSEPPQPSTFRATWPHNTSSFARSSKYRANVDSILREKVGALYVDLPQFHETFFGRVPGLKEASEFVFNKCNEGETPLFSDGWREWPKDANEDHVLAWLSEMSSAICDLAKGHQAAPTHLPRSPTQNKWPIASSTAERKMDIGFMDEYLGRENYRCSFSHVLVPGTLKNNPFTDLSPKEWLDIGRYAREVLAAQDSRRFVLGFTLCGSFMRIWEFDRLGGIAAKHFDINVDGLQFVHTILGFLWMDEETLGYDPTITNKDGKRIITIDRNAQPEHFIIDELICRSRRIASRATTCWKAHREEDPETPYVIKDSWQMPDYEDEGLLLQEATNAGVVNVARYYHHETVCIRGMADTIRSNVRGGQNLVEASNYRPESSWHTSIDMTQADRVHRRIVLADYGNSIYKASTRSALLAALESCIDGHESLHNAGILHRDISINNLMINEDPTNSSWPAFLIDLDLAIKEQLVDTSERDMAGTRVFMAIGALFGEPSSYMHDLESFFWVLFWICTHYDGPGKWIGSVALSFWNHLSDDNLASAKKELVVNEAEFIKNTEESFSPYYQPLVRWVNDLRKVVFPDGNRRWQPEPELYSLMKDVLREARQNDQV